MQTSCQVKIIIVTYNGMQWIDRCITSCGDYEVIVIDNASTDATVKTIKQNYPHVVLLEQTKNLGFGQANNVGISLALKEGAGFVFLLNQDAYLQPDVINKLIKVYSNNTDYGIISPIHLNGNGNKLDKNFSSYLKVNNTMIFDALQQDYSKEIYQVPFINAAAWLLPRKTLENIGGFDPIFFHYAEDDNYCQRALFHNFKIGIVPNVYVYHDREYDAAVKNNNSEEESLVLKERYYKHKWANVNVEVKKDIKKHKKRLFKLIIKFCIKFKFKDAVYCKRELTLINHIIPEIFNSRNINSKSGKHYL